MASMRGVNIAYLTHHFAYTLKGYLLLCVQNDEHLSMGDNPSSIQHHIMG